MTPNLVPRHTVRGFFLTVVMFLLPFARGFAVLSGFNFVTGESMPLAVEMRHPETGALSGAGIGGGPSSATTKTGSSETRLVHCDGSDLSFFRSSSK